MRAHTLIMRSYDHAYMNRLDRAPGVGWASASSATTCTNRAATNSLVGREDNTYHRACIRI